MCGNLNVLDCCSLKYRRTDRILQNGFLFWAERSRNSAERGGLFFAERAGHRRTGWFVVLDLRRTGQDLHRMAQNRGNCMQIVRGHGKKRRTNWAKVYLSCGLVGETGRDMLIRSGWCAWIGSRCADLGRVCWSGLIVSGLLRSA